MEGADFLIRNATLATMEPGGAPYGLIPDARARGPRRAHRLGRAGRGARRRPRRPARARSRRPAGHAGADRLPHPPRVRRRPGARVRAAARGRELRGGRPRRRRHRLDGARHPGGRRRRRCSPRRCARVDALIAEGVAVLEIKSGYGLDRETELAHAARRARDRPGRVRCACAPASSARTPCPTGSTADAYIDEVCIPTLRAAHAEGLVDAVDAFCEGIAFIPAQVARVFARRARPRPAGEDPRRAALEPRRRRAGGRVRRAFGRPPGVSRRGRASRAMAAAGTVAVHPARRLLHAARDPGAADRRCCASTACRWRSRPTAIPAPRR